MVMWLGYLEATLILCTPNLIHMLVFWTFHVNLNMKDAFRNLLCDCYKNVLVYDNMNRVVLKITNRVCYARIWKAISFLYCTLIKSLIDSLIFHKFANTPTYCNIFICSYECKCWYNVVLSSLIMIMWCLLSTIF